MIYFTKKIREINFSLKNQFQSQRFLEEEAEDGYKPCDPSIIVERVTALEDAYGELVSLAVERRSRLEESRQLWQFYW